MNGALHVSILAVDESDLACPIGNLQGLKN